MGIRPRTAFAAFALTLAATFAPQQQRVAPQASLASVQQYITRSWDVLTRSLHDLPQAAPDPKMHQQSNRPWPVYIAADEDRGAVEQRAPRRSCRPMPSRRIELRTLPPRLRGDPRARPALPAAPVRRPRRPLQRDVRLGQLLHPGRPAARRRDRRCARHGRQLPLRDRALRDDPEREPHLLPDALAAAVPDRDDPRRLRRRRTTAPGCAATLPGDRALLRVLDDGAAPRRRPGCRATSTSATGRRPRWSPTSGTRRAARTTTASREYYRTHRRQRLRRRRSYYDRGDRPADRPVLQGRPLDARVGLRSLEPLRPVQRRHHPLRAGLPELAALPDGGGRRARSTTLLGDAQAAGDVARARGRARRDADRPLPLGRARRAVLRLQLRRPDSRRHYEFATTFYPLWAGIASPEQARARARQPGAVRGAGRHPHEHAGDRQPVGRAVRLGAAADDRRRRACAATASTRTPTASRAKFVSLVVEGFDAHGTIVEKYDVQRRASDVPPGIKFGYSANQIGFGWTNAAVLELPAGLDRRPRLKGPGVLVH